MWVCVCMHVRDIHTFDTQQNIVLYLDETLFYHKKIKSLEI